jgi:aminopeptidase N
MPNQPLTRDEARTRAQLLSGVSYEVALRLEEGDTFTSDTILKFDCSQAGAATFVDLEAQAVVSAELNGRPVPAEAFNGSRLQLDGLAEHNRLRVVARCAYGRTGSGLHRFVDPVDGETYLHSQLEPFDAHRILTCFDQPDLRAPLSLRVWAPDGWAVIANSAPDGQPADGWHVFAPTSRCAPSTAASRWASGAAARCSSTSTPTRSSTSPAVGSTSSRRSTTIPTRSASTTRSSCPSAASAPWRTPAASPSPSATSSAPG